MTRKHKLPAFESMTRADTMAGAFETAKLLGSVSHPRFFKIAKEGRGFSVYYHTTVPKIKEWGRGKK